MGRARKKCWKILEDVRMTASDRGEMKQVMMVTIKTLIILSTLYFSKDMYSKWNKKKKSGEKLELVIRTGCS